MMTGDRWVLLPVDMQQAFDTDAWPRRWNRSVDDHGRQLLDAWRVTDRPVVHVRHDSVEPGSALRPGLPGHRHRDGFEPRPDEAVVAKSVNSAFVGTDLDLRLRRLGATGVVAFGFSTDMCVSTTVRHGANLGWPIVLAHDACDCFDLPSTDGPVIPAEEIHRAHVATLAHEFCEVASTAELVDRIGRQ